MTFEKNYAQDIWTLPSIFSTMTSLYPFSHEVNEPFKDILPSKIPTLAETLKKSGYTTLWVGDQSGSSNISNENGGTRGFDSIIHPTGFRDTDNWEIIAKQRLADDSPDFIYFYSSRLHFPYVLDRDEPLIENLGKPDGFPVTWEEESSSRADYLVENADRIFTELARKKSPEIFMNIKTVDKYKLLDYFRTLQIQDDDTGQPDELQNDAFSSVYESYTRHIYSDDKGDERKRVNFVRMLYDSKILSTDLQLSRLFKVLRDPNISRKTIVILLSDHGEEFMEHGSFSHSRHLYNELLHTPLFVKIPGLPPKKISEVTQNIDVYPTILNAIGVSNTFPIQGNSLLPLITGVKKSGYGYAISSKDYFQKFSIQNNDWKLIADFSAGPKAIELYNLGTDPTEQHNLIDIEKQKADELLIILIKKVEGFKIDSSKI